MIYAGQVDAATVRESGNSCSGCFGTTWGPEQILGEGRSGGSGRVMSRGCRAPQWGGGTAMLEGAGEDLGGLTFASQPLRETKIQVKALVNPDFNLL